MAENDYNEELGDLVIEGLKAKGMSIKKLAAKLRITYEHTRKIANGYPASAPLLMLVAKELDLDFNELERLQIQTNVRRKFGDTILEMQGKNPELEPVERVWKHLTEEQKQDAITMLNSWAKRSRHLARA